MLSAGRFFRLGFLWYVFPQDRHLLSCFFGRRFLIIPCPFFFCSILANRSGYSFSLPVYSLDYPSPAQPSLFLTGYFNAQVSGFRCLSPAPPHPFWPAILTPGYPVSSSSLPLRRVLFWPAILTPGYPVSGASLPLRSVSFWPAILPPGYPVFGAHLPLRHVFFWPAILTPRSPFSGTPGPSFRSPFWCPWSSFSTPSFSPTQPSLPGYLGGRLALCAALRYACGFYRSAVFTAPRFLPLHGFYRSAVFTAPLSPVFWGLCSSAALVLAAPQSSTTSGRLALCAALRFACDFYRSAVFTAPRFLPLRGFFLPLRFHRFFGGLCSSAALVLAAPQSSPTSGRLALCATLRYACDFYRSAVFTAPRFLPLRGFYRSAIFTAPLSPVLWGALLFLAAPQSSPSSGRTLCYRLVRSVILVRHSWSSFCTTCLTALGALPLISPVSLLCISSTLGVRWSSRLLSVGTRAPRVVPPPSWDLSAIGN